jgi:hypothetical protein
MREGLAIVGAGIVAVVCCAAIPLIVGVTGLSAAGILGVGGGILVLGAGALLVFSILRTRSHR